MRASFDIPLRMKMEIQQDFERQGFRSEAQWWRAAAHAQLRAGDAHRFREIAVTPRSSTPVDTFLEYLAAGRATLGDIIPAGGAMPSRLSRAMRAVLSSTQYARVVAVWVEGRTLEEVGRMQGCSRQAVHTTIQRAASLLAADATFAQALCDLFPDSGLTPEILRASVEARHERPTPPPRPRSAAACP